MTKEQRQETVRKWGPSILGLVVGTIGTVITAYIASQVFVARLDERIVALREALTEHKAVLTARVDRQDVRIDRVEARVIAAETRVSQVERGVER